MLLLFDLDGTLIDSEDSIVKACYSSLIHYSDKIPEKETITESVGLPIRNLLEQYCEKADLENVVQLFRENLIRETPISTKVYEDVCTVLEQLRSMGHILKVVTNKKEYLAVQVLKTMKLSDYFVEVIGIDKGEPKPSSEMLKYAARDWSRGSIPIMFGDRREDLLAAERAKFRSVLINRESKIVSVDDISGLIATLGSFYPIVNLETIQ